MDFKKIDLTEYATEDLRSLRNLISKEIGSRQNPHSQHSKAIIRRILRIHAMEPKDTDNYPENVARIRFLNGKLLAKLPSKDGKFSTERCEPYLSSLIAQDWSHLYPRETEDGEYYVYAHVDPRLQIFITSDDAGGNYGGQPFYIGKGIGNRAYDLKRNEGHGQTIREILSCPFPPSSIVRVLFSGLSEQKALEIESKLIYFFGSQYSVNEKGWLVNLSQPAVPEFEILMQQLPPEPIHVKRAQLTNPKKSPKKEPRKSKNLEFVGPPLKGEARKTYYLKLKEERKAAREKLNQQAK